MKYISIVDERRVITVDEDGNDSVLCEKNSLDEAEAVVLEQTEVLKLKYLDSWKIPNWKNKPEDQKQRWVEFCKTKAQEIVTKGLADNPNFPSSPNTLYKTYTGRDGWQEFVSSWEEAHAALVKPEVKITSQVETPTEIVKVETSECIVEEEIPVQETPVEDAYSISETLVPEKLDLPSEDSNNYLEFLEHGVAVNLVFHRKPGFDVAKVNAAEQEMKKIISYYGIQTNWGYFMNASTWKAFRYKIESNIDEYVDFGVCNITYVNILEDWSTQNSSIRDFYAALSAEVGDITEATYNQIKRGIVISALDDLRKALDTVKTYSSDRFKIHPKTITFIQKTVGMYSERIEETANDSILSLLAYMETKPSEMTTELMADKLSQVITYLEDYYVRLSQ
jgi:hypothetical protein